MSDLFEEERNWLERKKKKELSETEEERIEFEARFK